LQPAPAKEKRYGAGCKPAPAKFRNVSFFMLDGVCNPVPRGAGVTFHFLISYAINTHFQRT
jgi:hypothetical protein